MYCVRCGKEVLGTDKFCPYCGERIEAKKIVIENNASPESLKKRAFMFMEDNDFYSADAYVNRILSLEPEDDVAYIARVMIRNKIRTVDDFFRYWEDLHSEENYSIEDACEEDSKHIGDMVKENVVSNYLDEEAIREKYSFDRGVKLLAPCREWQRKQIDETFEKENDLNRARKFCDADMKKRFDAIFKAYDRRLKEARDEDKGRIREKKDQYKEFIQKTDETVRELHEKAVSDREDDHASLVGSYDEITDLEGFRLAHDKLVRLNGYKDSDDYLNRCDEKIAELEAIAAEEARKKRQKMMIIIGAAAVLLLAVSLYYSKIIVPRNNYSNALKMVQRGEYDDAIAAFDKLGDYQDSKDQKTDAIYLKAVHLYEKKDYSEAIDVLDSLDGYKDSLSYLTKARYDWGKKLYSEKKIDEAVGLFKMIGDYEDVSGIMEEIDKAYVYLEDLSGKKLADAQNVLNEARIDNYSVKHTGGTAGSVTGTKPGPGYIKRGTTVVVDSSLGSIDLEKYKGDGNTKVIFQVKVNQAGNSVRVRTSPVTLADLSNKVANLKTGNVRDVYEILEDSRYTWYRIGNQRWIATESGWVSIID